MLCLSSAAAAARSFYTARDRRLQAQLQRALWQAARSVALEHLQQLHAAQVGSSEAVPDYNDVEEAFVEAARDAFQVGPCAGASVPTTGSSDAYCWQPASA